jgi:hypothetical protein
VQRLSARGQDDHAWTGREQRGDIWGGGEHLLATIEEKQHPS